MSSDVDSTTANVAKLAMLFGLEGWYTFSLVSVSVTVPSEFRFVELGTLHFSP